MTSMFNEPLVSSAHPLHGTSTTTEWIASSCIANHPGPSSVQLCVMGIGLSFYTVTAGMILQALSSNTSERSVCVVLPEKLAASHLQGLTHAIGYALRRSGTAAAAAAARHTHVHVLEEGTSTKDRCHAYQIGGVILTTSRMLCADLLHRRVSPELVGLCIIGFPGGGSGISHAAYAFTDWTIHLAFCVEILIRGDRRVSAHAARSGQTAISETDRPRIVILSDNPIYMQYLVQRRQVGREHFTQLMHIGDIQLFPRFRLDVIQHYEELAKTKPLRVDSVVVNASAGAKILDELLRKILLEVLSELQSAERRQQQQQQQQPATTSGIPEKNASGQPHARSRLESDGSGLARWKPGAAKNASSGGGRPPRYNAYGDEHDAKVLHMSRITEAAALDVRFGALDADMQYALQANEHAWPCRPLVLSFLDVRRLIRTVRQGTPYDFLFVLEDVLRRRVPMRSIYPAAAPPAAAWTLSTHFSDVITVATKRIGEVTVSSASPQMQTTTTAEDVVDVDESDDDVVITDGGNASAAFATRPQLTLLPSDEEHEYEFEVAARLARSWVRDTVKKASKLPDVSAESTPCILIVVFGLRALARFVERLVSSSPAQYRRTQLAHFLGRYQSLHGARVAVARSDAASLPASSSDAKAAAAVLLSKPSPDELSAWLCSAAMDEAADESMNDIHSDDEDDERAGKPTPAPSSSMRVTQTLPLSHDDIDPTFSSLHQLLMSQEAASPGVCAGLADIAGHSESSAFSVECVGASAALLSSSASPQLGVKPKVVVMDGYSLTAGKLLEMMRGEHQLFSSFANSGNEEVGGQPITAVAGMTVRRVILTRQSLAVMRMLEAVQDELTPTELGGVKVQLVSSVWSSDHGTSEVAAEQSAFESLAHTKATLTATVLTDHASMRQTAAMLESGLSHFSRDGQLSRRRPQQVARLQGTFIYESPQVAQAPVIIFDEREFRSMLPYHLFSRSMQLVPLTLTTADYVLSPNYAVERKSVPDYLQSLQSGRVMHQLSALSRKYEHPILLVEFNRSHPFRLVRSTADNSFSRSIYARTARLVAAHPQVTLMWTCSAAHSAGIMATLKHTVAQENVDPSSPSLTAPAIDGESGDASERDAAHYAARVLAKFPGVTPSNAEAVMRLCGSLAGLATISEASLISVMGEENGHQLFSYLHEPFAISI